MVIYYILQVIIHFSLSFLNSRVYPFAIRRSSSYSYWILHVIYMRVPFTDFVEKTKGGLCGWG